MSAALPGTILAGKYRVTKVLGEGGMGVVVAAVHMQLDELVAIKLMLPHALDSAEAIGRFLREARAAVKLKSEHVARVSDVGTLESGAPYIVMEHLEGADLGAILTTRGPLPPEEAVDYVIQACDALAEAHALGIVHRDLKPANLFLTHRRDGSPLVKVLDFGISKSTALSERGESLTKTGGGLMGSPQYMSPEQMKSAKTADARTDIWALGVILYELVGGRAPFESETLGGLIAQVLTEAPPPLPSVRPGLPPALYAAIERCLEKDRDRRWANVAELAASLSPIAPASVRPLIERMSAVLGRDAAKQAVETNGGHGSLAPAAMVRSAPGTTAPGWADVSEGTVPRSGKRGLAVAAGVAVLGAIAVVGVLAWRRESLPPPVTAVAPEARAAAVATASESPRAEALSAPTLQEPAPTPPAPGNGPAAPTSSAIPGGPPAHGHESLLTASPSSPPHRAHARAQPVQPFSSSPSPSASSPQGNALFDGRR